jgi:hypothetical protein
MEYETFEARRARTAGPAKLDEEHARRMVKSAADPVHSRTCIPIGVEELTTPYTNMRQYLAVRPQLALGFPAQSPIRADLF